MSVHRILIALAGAVMLAGCSGGSPSSEPPSAAETAKAQESLKSNPTISPAQKAELDKYKAMGEGKAPPPPPN